MNTKTTDLSHLRKFPSAFTWGRIVAFYDLGPYTIAEYDPRTRDPKLEMSNYHVWVDGKNTHHGARSLEEAILLAIGIRNLGANSGPHMARAAFKILQ